MFIELTLKDGTKSTFNRNHIVHFWELGNGAGIETIIHSAGDYFEVKESYEELREFLVTE